MSTIDLEVSDLGKLDNMCVNIEAEISERIHETMLYYMDLIKMEAMMNTPVETGRLMTGYIIIDEGMNEVTVTNLVEYFPFVEAIYHMLEDAFNRYADIMEAEIDRIVEEYVVESL